MDKLITVKDVKERYKCSLQTARKYIRQCNPHLENPLAVPEWSFREWEASRTVVDKPMSQKQFDEVMKRMKTGDRLIIPRR